MWTITWINVNRGHVRSDVLSLFRSWGAGRDGELGVFQTRLWTTTYCVLWMKYGKRFSTSSCRATNENVSAETREETKVGVTGKRIMDRMVSACTGESADSRSASALTLFTPRCVLFSLLMREWRQPGGKSETSVLYLPAVMCSWYKVCPQTSALKTKSKCTQVSEITADTSASWGLCSWSSN